ncbi:MAG: ferritin family protein [Desulfoprunum sp.]|nr:ferritin family protein [Desulfoprunum sp.]
MRLDEAILTAIEYETRVRDHYLNSTDRIRNRAGRRVFELLASEEQGHIDYLLARLGQWRRDGTLSLFSLTSALPTGEDLQKALKSVEQLEPRDILDDERQVLDVALNLEKETSDYYRRLVGQVDGPAREMFKRFLEIEDGHVAMVQAEIDYLSDNGFWFDFAEFNMEH